MVGNLSFALFRDRMSCDPESGAGQFMESHLWSKT